MRINPPIPFGGSKLKQADSRSHAFTVVELVVVLGLIVVLAGLLISSLDTARRKAMRMTCLDNLKQLQLAWSLYADDNDDRIPLNQGIPSVVGNKFARRLTTNSWVSGNPREDLTTASVQKGTLYPYVRTVEVFRCPVDGSHVPAHPNSERTRSYSMNSYLGADNSSSDPRVKMKVSDLSRPGPSRTFVFIEEHENSIWTSGFLVIPAKQAALVASSMIPSSTPSDRHEKGAHLTFADSHIEYWRWYTPKGQTAAGVHLSSDSLEKLDVARLQSVIPQP